MVHDIIGWMASWADGWLARVCMYDDEYFLPFSVSEVRQSEDIAITYSSHTANISDMNSYQLRIL